MFYRVRTAQEIKQIVNLGRSIWTEHYTPLIGTKQVQYMLNNFHSETQITEQIDRDDYLYFLIKSKTEEIGYFGVKISGKVLFLSKIYILASERMTGIGRASIEFIKNLAQKYKLEKISLTVNKYNTGSIAAYAKFGFIKTGEVWVYPNHLKMQIQRLARML